LILIDFKEKQKLLQITQNETGAVGDGVQRPVTPGFHNFLRRSRVTSPYDVQNKVVNPRSLSDMQATSPPQEESQEAPTPSPSPRQEQLQEPSDDIRSNSDVVLTSR
jgi:hypothetical protein